MPPRIPAWKRFASKASRSRSRTPTSSRSSGRGGRTSSTSSSPRGSSSRRATSRSTRASSGSPGVGKTTLAYAAAKRIGRPAWVFQATVDTRPEDLLVTPVVAGEGKIRYVASGVVTAMLKGGVAILDEGNRMSEKSWASLAPAPRRAADRRVDRRRA